MDRTASGFFNEDGIVATTARLVLRRPVRDDLLAYIDTFSEGLRKEYLRNDASGDSLRRGYWDDVSSEGSLFCTITASKDRRTCGFCCIERLEEDPSEIGIRLLPEFRGRGIGGEAVSALVAGVERMAGPTEFGPHGVRRPDRRGQRGEPASLPPPRLLARSRGHAHLQGPHAHRLVRGAPPRPHRRPPARPRRRVRRGAANAPEPLPRVQETRDRRALRCL